MIRTRWSPCSRFSRTCLDIKRRSTAECNRLRWRTCRQWSWTRQRHHLWSRRQPTSSHLQSTHKLMLIASIINPFIRQRRRQISIRSHSIITTCIIITRIICRAIKRLKRLRSNELSSCAWNVCSQSETPDSQPRAIRWEFPFITVAHS